MTQRPKSCGDYVTWYKKTTNIFLGVDGTYKTKFTFEPVEGTPYDWYITLFHDGKKLYWNVDGEGWIILSTEPRTWRAKADFKADTMGYYKGGVFLLWPADYLSGIMSIKDVTTGKYVASKFDGWMLARPDNIYPWDFSKS